MKNDDSTTRQADEAFRTAVCDQRSITGLTHEFYRYPARFSPRFVRIVIERFSNPGDVILDPFLGGGTTAVEALANSRRVVGNDVNSLSIFLARVKTTPLSSSETESIARWASELCSLRYTMKLQSLELTKDERLRNMSLPQARFIKKLAALVLESLDSLPSPNAQDFGRCVVLKTSQWALDGKRTMTTLGEFREKLAKTAFEMLAGMELFKSAVPWGRGGNSQLSQIRTLIHGDASEIDQHDFFSGGTQKPKLVVTSPPYPGVHVLYHRWQVDGRKETPAPYWIAGCNDGDGSSHYTFGCRKQKDHARYFQKSLETLRAVRSIIHPRGTFVQLIAFSDPASQLQKYLSNMEVAGFREIFPIQSHNPRIWRDVPNRKWHASLRGRTHSSKEVVLFHKPA